MLVSWGKSRVFSFVVWLLGGALINRGKKHFSLHFCWLGVAVAEENTLFISFTFITLVSKYPPVVHLAWLTSVLCLFSHLLSKGNVYKVNCSGLFWYICYIAKCLCQKTKSKKSFLNLQHWLHIKLSNSKSRRMCFFFLVLAQNDQRSLYWLFDCIFYRGNHGKEKIFALFQKYSKIAWIKAKFCTIDLMSLHFKLDRSPVTQMI